MNTYSLPSCSILAWSVSLRGLERHLGWRLWLALLLGWASWFLLLFLFFFASVGKGGIFYLDIHMGT